MFQIKRHSIPLNTVVFEGNDFLSFIGTYEALTEAKRVDQLTTLAGTSSGAIIAMLLALGFTLAQVREKLQQLTFIEITTPEGITVWDIEPIRDVIPATNELDASKRQNERLRSWLEKCVTEKLISKYATLDQLAEKHAASPKEFKQLYLTAIDAQTGKLCPFSAAHHGSTSIVDSVLAAVSFSGDFVPSSVGNRLYSNKSDESQFPIELVNSNQVASKFEKIPAGENNTGILHVKSSHASKLLQFSWFKQKEVDDPLNAQKYQCVCDHEGNLILPTQDPNAHALFENFAKKFSSKTDKFPNLENNFSFEAAKKATLNWLHHYAKPAVVQLSKSAPNLSTLLQSDKFSLLEQYESLLARKAELEKKLQAKESISKTNSNQNYYNYDITYFATINDLKKTQSEYDEFNPQFETFIKSHSDVIKEYQLRNDQQKAIKAATDRYFVEHDDAATVLTIINQSLSHSENNELVEQKYTSMSQLDSTAVSTLQSKLSHMMGVFQTRFGLPQPRRNLHADIKKMEMILSLVRFTQAYMNENPIVQATKKPFREYDTQCLKFLEQRIEKNRQEYMDYMLTEDYRARVFVESLERMIILKNWEVGFQLCPKKIIRPSGEEKMLPTGVAQQLKIIDSAMITCDFIEAQKNILLIGAYYARGNHSFFSNRKQSTRDYYAHFEKADKDATPSIIGVAPSLYPAAG